MRHSLPPPPRRRGLGVVASKASVSLSRDLCFFCFDLAIIIVPVSLDTDATGTNRVTQLPRRAQRHRVHANVHAAMGADRTGRGTALSMALKLRACLRVAIAIASFRFAEKNDTVA